VPAVDLAPLLLLGALASCATAAVSRAPAPDVSAGVRIVDAAVAGEYSASRRSVTVPFQTTADGTSGTELVRGYLLAAQAGGAAFVSDLRFHVTFRAGGQPMECETRVLVGDEDAADAADPPIARPAPAPPTTAYSTQLAPIVPARVTRWVNDRELVCTDEPRQVVSWQKQYDHRHDVEVGRWVEKNPDVQVVEIVHDRRCETRALRRRVTRYEFQLATRLTPPDLGAIGREFSDGRLRESAPRCYAISLVDGHLPPHRLEGVVYQRAGDGQRWPKALRE
jgi:hypothetical protein